ncbi:Sec8 exocyst complex component-specific domain-containing protein [Microdochium trichocladiopsis]|uniref:Exocyst complex component Sec8 n=1 Tax=Microdochium trichocladiopsis TaxID=1682393 RepID=A0A9P8Y8X0_9PEZI|nr:Sec8 exocyst complex component-specific domain-containing protein [Microdochium trichocladiopsis]KAH7033138.1 Sec8 exocyst complex component-specific domain-containing protein [Microdochium trichocladiopsis]
MSNRYNAAYRSGNANGGSGGGGYGGLGPPRDRQGGGGDDYDPYGDEYTNGDRLGTPPQQQMNPRRLPPEGGYRNGGGGGGYGGGPTPGSFSSSQRAPESSAERQISQVLLHIKSEWPAMVDNDCIPVQLALQLLDTSSVGRAHEYRKFQQTHQYLQDSLKGIVHEHHQGFNSSIGTFHKIQGSIQASQKKVRALKDSLTASRASLSATDPELKKLYKSSQMYDDVLQTLNELEELRGVPDQLEARISEKRFLTAVDVLQNALRKLRKPDLDEIGALSDLRSYLANQETALMDILVEELHEHLYLKSPYCQERWQSLSKQQGAHSEKYNNANAMLPFHMILDSLDSEHAVTEDPSKNPEADTFWYIGLLVESLNKLGRLESAVEVLKQRLPVELFTIVNETVNEVDTRHPSSLRGGTTNAEGLYIYGSRETQMRADVIYDLMWSLYGKFEAIAEGHRIFHESIKALMKREGAGSNSTLLGSFRELWNLYQNEIRSLLHNYVTTDADVYQFSSSPRVGAMLNGNKAGARDNLFKFSAANSKSEEMVTEYDALDSIIQAAVPGLTSGSRKPQAGGADKKSALLGKEARRETNENAYENAAGPGSYKSLVEPSVFNMSLLLPPTLVFLQRLKSIVPPGSDLAASTLTSFLDNFLVNVFQPQLDETLAKLSENVLGELDSFQQDSDWSLLAKRPVFKGTTSFFAVVTAFCRMLGDIPHDQALSSLIVSQMHRYYERCSAWFIALVSKSQENASAKQALRYSAEMATNDGPLHEIITKLWTAAELDPDLIETEVKTLISQTGERTLETSDVIQDRDVISSLCLLYTSMKWLSVKVTGLRHITKQETDSSRPSMQKAQNRRWTLLNDPHKVSGSSNSPVHLPMTQETAKSFDAVITSYESLANTVLLTLHAEVRCRIVQSLAIALSPETAPYVLGEQEIREPDPQILSLNSELVAYDEITTRFLRERELRFIRSGLGLLVNRYLITNALATQPMNSRGCDRMQLNILVLQQNLKNIEPGVDLGRAADFYALFQDGPDALVEKVKGEVAARQQQQSSDADGADGSAGGGGGISSRFTYDELKTLLELSFSEQVHDPERGVAAAAKRQLNEKVLALSELMWQS